MKRNDAREKQKLICVRKGDITRIEIGQTIRIKEIPKKVPAKEVYNYFIGSDNRYHYFRHFEKCEALKEHLSKNKEEKS